ncbi:MAG TPA: protein kinase [Polyangiaceae bacterium]
MATKAETIGEKWSVAAATSGLVPIPEQSFQMPFATGEVIAAKYEVTELIGVGGVGFVVAAKHIELGEKVALKFLRPEMLVRLDVVARFAQEALAAVRIKNEHVARVYDVGTLPNGCPFIVMEYLEGRDLYDVIVHDGPQPIKRAVDYVLQACEAIADAHSRGIVHRDIKPENLFLIQRSEGMELVKVLDFGISKVALTGSAFTSKVPLVRTMLPMGSPVYMSPEQIRASKDIDVRTDIWSMGCVLHELLTGRPAFDAPSLTQLSATILEEHPPKVSDIIADCPPEIDAIVSRCLNKQPEARYQNMAELAMALYPFGPRRSRLSAERCCMLLKVEGATYDEFELPSMRPPGAENAPSGAYSMRLNTNHGSSSAVRFTGGKVETEVENPFKPRVRLRTLLLVGGFVCLAALTIGLWSIPRDNVDSSAASDATAKARADVSVTSPTQAGANVAVGSPAVHPTVAPANRADSSASTPPTSASGAKSGVATSASKSNLRMLPKLRKRPSNGHDGISTEPDPGF